MICFSLDIINFEVVLANSIGAQGYFTKMVSKSSCVDSVHPVLPYRKLVCKNLSLRLFILSKKMSNISLHESQRKQNMQ